MDNFIHTQCHCSHEEWFSKCWEVIVNLSVYFWPNIKCYCNLENQKVKRYCTGMLIDKECKISVKVLYVEAFKFAKFRGLWVFCSFVEMYFMNRSVFSFSKKTLSKFVFIEDVNSYRRATHEYLKNWATINFKFNDSAVIYL